MLIVASTTVAVRAATAATRVINQRCLQRYEFADRSHAMPKVKNIAPRSVYTTGKGTSGGRPRLAISE